MHVVSRKIYSMEQEYLAVCEPLTTLSNITRHIGIVKQNEYKQFSYDLLCDPVHPSAL